MATSVEGNIYKQSSISIKNFFKERPFWINQKMPIACKLLVVI